MRNMSPSRKLNPQAAQFTAGGFIFLLLSIAIVWLIPGKPSVETKPLPATYLPPTPTPVIVTTTPDSLPSWLTVYFTDPDPPDDIEHGVDQYIVPLIENASRNVDVASFDLNLPSVVDALVRARARGAEVRVLYDGVNGNQQLDADRSPTGVDYDAVEVLRSAGIPLVNGGRSNGLMHDKFLLIDGQYLVTGSWNISYNDTYRNNNNALVITDLTLINNYQVKFNELFAKTDFTDQSQAGAQVPVIYIVGVNVANYFSPADEVMDKLVALVDSAQDSVYFMAFTYTHPDLVQAMVERHNAGVDVQGIFENRGATQGAMVPLYCANVPVKVDGNKYTMHDKVIVIDKSMVITGSFNFTDAADTANDDNLIVIQSPALAQLYLQEYERLNANAQPPTYSEEFLKAAQQEKWAVYCK
jgi:phosphatidylserine/phosphatidylglycerophosphate/cardiolipin synthase-like enzyme